MILTIGPHTFEAAIVRYEGYSSLSYIGNPAVFLLGRVYKIDNKDYVVESVSASLYVSGVVNVKLRNS